LARLNGPPTGHQCPPRRQTVNRRRPALPLHYSTWPVYCPPT